MEVVIITGMSGAGKSSAMRALEDMDYFCIDNLPPGLLSGLLQAFRQSEEEQNPALPQRVQKLAIGIDIRGLIRFGNIPSDFSRLFPENYQHKIIFMEASNEALVSRYKQTRRNHPLASQISLIDAISRERVLLQNLREISDIIIDTTELSLSDLKETLFNTLQSDDSNQLMTVLVQSFGYKYGIPLDSDLVFDVRFLPNPFYEENLRELSGLDQPVRDFIFAHDQVHTFLECMRKFFEFSLPLYQEEGKVRLMIAVGCTGGRHRSVSLAEELSAILRDLGYHVLTEHRDIERDPAGGI